MCWRINGNKAFWIKIALTIQTVFHSSTECSNRYQSIRWCNVPISAAKEHQLSIVEVTKVYSFAHNPWVVRETIKVFAEILDNNCFTYNWNGYWQFIGVFQLRSLFQCCNTQQDIHRFNSGFSKSEKNEQEHRSHGSGFVVNLRLRCIKLCKYVLKMKFMWRLKRNFNSNVECPVSNVHQERKITL